MPAKLASYLNKTIFVSMPALFEDGTCRPYKLVGAEINGLWLQSDELTQRLLPADRQDLASLSPAVYVPFSQIAGVLVATGIPEQNTQGQPQKTPPGITPSAEAQSHGHRKRR